MAAEGKSRWRRRRLLAALSLVVAGAILYQHLTDPVRLRAKALQALQRLPLDGLELGNVTFSPRDGIQVEDIVLRPRAGGPLYQAPPGAALPPLLHIRAATIQPELWQLVLGRVQPRSIELRGVECAFIMRAGATQVTPSVGQDAGRWLVHQVLREIGDLPPLRVRQADVQMLVLEQGRTRTLARTLLKADGQQTTSGYAVRFDYRPVAAQPAAELSVDRNGEISARIDWVDLATIAPLLPPRVLEVLQKSQAGGRARAARLVWRATPQADAAAVQERARPPAELVQGELELADVHVDVPLEDERAVAARAPVGSGHGGPSTGAPYLRFDDGVLQLSWHEEQPGSAPEASDPGAVTLHGAARLRGGALTLTAALRPAGLRRLLSDISRSAASDAEMPPEEPDASLANALISGELSITGFELPTRESFPAFVGSRQLGGPIYAAFEDYSPHGKANLNIRLPAVSNADVETLAQRLEADVELLGGICQYKYFPYAVDEVRGTVRLKDGAVLIDSMHGRHGPAEVTVSGRLENTTAWTAFDVQIEGRNVPLDGTLYAALPRDYHALWSRAAPVGLSDIRATVTRAPGTAQTGPLRPEVRVAGHLLSGSLSIADGRRIDHADGWISVDRGVVQVSDLHGFAGDASVRVDGALRLTGTGPRTDLRIEAHDVPIAEYTAGGALAGGTAVAAAGESIRNASGASGQAAAPASKRDWPPAVHVDGRASVWGRMYELADGERGQHLAVRLQPGGSLTGRDAERPWTVQDGWLRIGGQEMELKSLVCTQGTAVLEAHGDLPRPGVAAPVRFDLHLTTPAIEQFWGQFLGPDAVQPVDALGAFGQGELNVHLRPDEAESAAARAPDGGEELAPAAISGAVGQVTEIRARLDHVRPKAVPLELHTVEAEVALRSNACEIRSVTAQCGSTGRLRAAGTAHWSGAGANAEFAGNASALEFSPELIGALPQRLRELLVRIEAHGQFDLLLPEIAYRAERSAAPAAGALEGNPSMPAGAGGSGAAWHFGGRMPLHGVALRLGLDLRDVEGELAGTCDVRADGEAEIAAGFTIQSGKLAGRALADWHGRLERPVGNRWVRLNDLEGRLCDGLAQGELAVNPQTAEYELVVRLQDVALAQLFPASAERRPAGGQPGARAGAPAESRRRGRLDGEVWLRGYGADAGTRRGGGTVRISGASFFGTPVLARIFEQAPRVRDDAVDQALFEFAWEGQELQLTRVDVRGRDLRLVGTGTWNLRADTVNLTLYGASPANWPRVAGLTDFLELAGQEIVQYRVEGSIDAPRVTAEPLHRITEAVRRLLE